MAYYKTCRSTHLNKYPDTCATTWAQNVTNTFKVTLTDRHINRTLATSALWGWHLVAYQANLRQPTSTGFFCRLCGWAKETKEHKGCGGTTCPGSHSPLDFQNGPLKWPFWKSMQPDFRWKQKVVKAKLPDVVPHAAPAVPRCFREPGGCSSFSSSLSWNLGDRPTDDACPNNETVEARRTSGKKANTFNAQISFSCFEE